MAESFGWDASRIYTTNVMPPGQSSDLGGMGVDGGDESRELIEQAFITFIRDFKLDQEFVYR